jgi:hypothetical protein
MMGGFKIRGGVVVPCHSGGEVRMGGGGRVRLVSQTLSNEFYELVVFEMARVIRLSIFGDLKGLVSSTYLHVR